MVAFRKVWFLSVFLWVFESFSFNHQALAVTKNTTVELSTEEQVVLSSQELTQLRARLILLEKAKKSVQKEVEKLIKTINKSIITPTLMSEINALNDQKATIWKADIDGAQLTAKQKDVLKKFVDSIYSENPGFFINFNHINTHHQNNTEVGRKGSAIYDMYLALQAVSEKTNSWFMDLGRIAKTQSKTSSRIAMDCNAIFDITAILETYLLKNGFYKINSTFIDNSIDFVFDYLANTLPKAYFQTILETYQEVLEAFKDIDQMVLLNTLNTGIVLPSKNPSSHGGSSSQYEKILAAIKKTLQSLNNKPDSIFAKYKILK